MIVCTSEHRVFHHDTVLPQRDRLSFREHTGSEHDSAASTGVHNAADCGIRRHITVGVDDWFLIVMRQNHLNPRRIRPSVGTELCSQKRPGGLSVVFVALYYAEAEPAPVDAMALDKASVIKFHRFYKVHLVAFWRGAWILPNESFSVGQISGAVILPDRGFALCDCFKKIRYLLPPTAHSLLFTEYVRN